MVCRFAQCKIGQGFAHFRMHGQNDAAKSATEKHPLLSQITAAEHQEKPAARGRGMDKHDHARPEKFDAPR